jgi:hypothetical protein
MAVVAGVGLDWERNALSGERNGLSVLFGGGASALPTLVFLGALPVAFAGVVVYHRKAYARAAVAAALIALGVAGWFGIRIVGTHVRAIGMDSAGNLVEPEAAGHLGIGWYLTTAALLTTAGLAVSRARPDRRPPA